jgi:site-specific DNA-methyltransferase (adenine-specific)
VIHTGDCIEVMAGMDANSVDAIVTDPPYGLGFMGKEWDSVRAEASRPPSAVDPAAGTAEARGAYPRTGKGPAAVSFAGQPFQAWCEAWGREALRVAKPGAYLLAFGGTRTHHRLVCGLEDAGWIIRDELDWIYASGFPKGKANLKPAHEPIVLARKPGPLQPLAIDDCRIPGAVPLTVQGRSEHTYGNGKGFAPEGLQESNPDPAGRWPSNLLLSDPALFDEPNPEVVGSGATATSGEPGIKWGGNEGSAYGAENRVPGTQMGGYGDSGGYSRFFIIPKADRADREPVLRGQREQAVWSDGREKAADYPSQRGKTSRENSHPTVKPVDLMRHLVRLVTPPGGTVLDCFLGSGSTAIAAELEGFPWVGIEKEPEYVAIAEARLNGTQRGLGLDVPAPTEARKSVDGVAVRHNSGGNTFGGDSPKPEPVPVADPTTPMFPEEVA